MRAALRDRRTHDRGNRIRCARVVFLLVAEKRIDVARGREPDAEHQRILRRVLQLVQQRGVEAVLHADVRRIRSSGKGVSHNSRRPISSGNFQQPARTPVALSDTAETSVALSCRRRRRIVGGVARGMISAAVVPLLSGCGSRAVSDAAASGFLGGYLTRLIHSRRTTSPCQPLTSDMCPFRRTRCCRSVAPIHD